MEVERFEDIADEFHKRVSTMVWCNVATVDSEGRPRSRILHPIWEDTVNGVVGWIGTRPTSYKAKNLARNPYVSVAYISDITKPVYAECIAEWVDDAAGKQYVWDLMLSTPQPYGYDPAPIFQSVEHPSFGVLKLTPWRIELNEFPLNTRIWRSKQYPK